jgi:acetyltransferase-like isoleucine patch superfamily enzyme
MLLSFKAALRRLFHAMLGHHIDSRINYYLLHKSLIYGDPSRVTVSPCAIANNALFNTMSGQIVVEGYAFLGHNVSLLTGTHDMTVFGRERQASLPHTGHDIIIRNGAWIASNVTVIGPCEIGENAVVAAGSLVISNVPPYAIFAGVPAGILRYLNEE